MTVHSSCSALSAHLFKLTQQIDHLYKKLELCSSLLYELSHMPSYEQTRPLQALSRDLRKHHLTLSKLQQKLRELLESDLPAPSLEQVDALYYQLEELWQVHQVLTTQIEELQYVHDNLDMHLNVPAFLNA